MKTEKRETPPAAAPERIQRMFEDMGLGSEAERQRLRDLGNWPNYGHLPNPRGGARRGAAGRLADQGDLALAAMRKKLEEYRRRA